MSFALVTRIRKLANEKKLHVWIVAHPTKSTQWNDERPSMYSIAGGADWRLGMLQEQTGRDGATDAVRGKLCGDVRFLP